MEVRPLWSPGCCLSPVRFFLSQLVSVFRNEFYFLLLIFFMNVNEYIFGFPVLHDGLHRVRD